MDELPAIMFSAEAAEEAVTCNKTSPVSGTGVSLWLQRWSDINFNFRVPTEL